MRTIVWFTYFWLYLIAVYPMQKSFERKKTRGVFNQKDAEKINMIVTKWANRLLNLAGVTYTVRGKENIPKDRAVLFTCNHQGYFDIPLVITQLDKVNPLIAKKELEGLPLVSSWMRLIDCMFLDRGNARSSLQVFEEAERLIKSGHSVIIFPEGTRSRSDELGEFKNAAFKPAIRTGVEIVPVAIDGSYRVMEKNGMWIKPAHINITVLPPIKTDDMDREESKHIGKKVCDMIMECRTEEKCSN